MSLSRTCEMLCEVQYRMAFTGRHHAKTVVGRKYYKRLERAEAYLVKRELRRDPAALGRCRRREGSLPLAASNAGVVPC